MKNIVNLNKNYYLILNYAKSVNSLKCIQFNYFVIIYRLFFAANVAIFKYNFATIDRCSFIFLNFVGYKKKKLNIKTISR